MKYKNFKDNKDAKAHSTDEYKIKERFDAMEEIFKKIEIDDGYKNNAISPKDKSLLILKSDGKCEMCGKELENFQIDHKTGPKSISSKTDYGILCPSCNNKKSNLTPEEIEQLNNYVNN